MNPTTAFLIGPGFLLMMFSLETKGSPVVFNGQPKPPNCPYGQCFIDRCIRICSCQSPEGNISCTKNLYSKSALECGVIEGTDNCPLGQTYRSPVWKDNFLCYCNNDASQTYECFDLSKQTSADVRELLIIRNNSKGHQIIAATGGKRSTESTVQKLKIH